MPSLPQFVFVHVFDCSCVYKMCVCVYSWNRCFLLLEADKDVVWTLEQEWIIYFQGDSKKKDHSQYMNQREVTCYVTIITVVDVPLTNGEITTSQLAKTTMNESETWGETLGISIV